MEPASQPQIHPLFQLLVRCCFLLFSPAALDGLGNALPSFRGKMSLLFSLLCDFPGGRGGRNLFVRCPEAAGQQSAGPLQLSNFMIDLYQNF